MLLKARWVLPVRGPAIENGAVVVDGERIAAVGRASDLAAEYGQHVVRDLGAAALLPGFVNAHSHLELTAMRGLLEDADFRTWITRLTAIKLDRMTHDDLLDSARIGALEAVRGGVTCVADTCDSGVVAEAMRDAGLRGVMFQEVFGPDPAQAADSTKGLVAKLDRLVQENGSIGRVRIGISPHAPFTVSADLYARCTQLSIDRGLPLAIHAAESRAERDFLVDGSGPFGERFRQRGIPWTPPGTTTIGWLDAIGVLAAKPLLIHAVHASRDDLDRVAASASSIAHCPKSNAKLGHGVAPLRGMIESGARVGLGTDSVASNNVCDMLDEARFAALMARAHGCDVAALSARTALELATIGGAETLGMADEIGSLEPGKRADLCAISLEGLHAQPIHDVEAALVFSNSASDVMVTVVGGEVVFDRDAEQPTRQDEERLMVRLGEIGKAISLTNSG